MSGYRNSMANFGLSLIFPACCLNSNAIVIAVPPSITLATPIIGHPLMAPVAVTPSAANANDQTILCFIFIESGTLLKYIN
jgi:hypothetical protein